MVELILAAFSFLAGFLDAVVGGGGMIQLPALFVFLPPTLAAQVPAVLGTNKLASICGTSMAVAQYSRHVQLNWKVLWPAAVTALLFSLLGARTASILKPELLRPVILVLLIVVAAYTAVRKDFGKFARPEPPRSKQLFRGSIIGALLGFYDGFFGPGTGSFLIFGFVTLFGWEFLRASASAKVINWATNLSAVAYFACTDQIYYRYAIPMAMANMAGAFFGSRMAVLKGSEYVRRFFLLVMLALIARFAWELFKSS